MVLKLLKSRVVNAPRRVRLPQKPNGLFYQSPEWRALRDSVVTEVGYCQKCGATGTRLIGDHIIEIKDGGGRLDRANVGVLCIPCNTRKGAAAKRYRLQGMP